MLLLFLPPANAHAALRLALRLLVLTTSTVARKGKTGRITALQALNDYGGKNACILLCVACDTLVPIRTGLGTSAVLVGSALTVALLWNFSGWKLGTIKNLQVLLVCVLHLFQQHL